MRELTKLERYQFSLTSSEAKTVRSQLAAIEREGLTGQTRANMLYNRRAKFRQFRGSRVAWNSQADIAKLPAWLAAARFEENGDDWQHVAPVKTGEAVDCSSLAWLAHDSVEWGRRRKHQTGSATAHKPSVRETTNGKSGWDCVTWRYADYLCVVSPDGKTVAVQVDSEPIELHAVRSHRFVFRGKVCHLANHPKRTGNNVKITTKILARVCPGEWEAVNTPASQGAKPSPAYRELSTGEEYHFSAYITHRNPTGEAREAFDRRARNREQTEILALVERGEAADIYVCAADSYRVGNCKAGTSSFANRHNLDLTRHYRAGEIAEIANGDGRFVRAAIVAAVRRDRREKDQGYCDLSEHTA